MSSTLWIVPSRSRPDNIKKLITSFATTRSQATLMVATDWDDPKLPEYREVMLQNDYPWLHYREGDRLRLAGTLNKLALMMAGAYDQIGFMGDDHRPRTAIWDGLMATELRRLGTGIVYGNDLFQRHLLPTQVCMTSDIIRTLGYMVPPTMKHLYLDNFWLLLGQELNRITYMEHVIIEHLHPHAGKAEMDKQYEELNSSKQADADLQAFTEYKEERFQEDLEKLKKLLDA